MTPNPNKALWEKGDFTRLAANMRESGEALVSALGIEKGLKVLDLGCGDGTTAIPQAKRGADVLGVDIASNLVAAGNRRVKELGLTNCRFQEGDASNLHELENDSFDLVVSIFGARRQGDGARHAPRRTDRHGQLDSRRSDAGRAGLEDQFGLHATSTGRVHQPDDVGRREQCDRAIWGRGNSEGAGLVPARQLHFQLSRLPAGIRGGVPRLLRADHECFPTRRQRTTGPATRRWKLSSSERTRARARTRRPSPRPFCG